MSLKKGWLSRMLERRRLPRARAGQSSVGSLVQLLHGGASGKVVSREIAMLATCWPGGEFNGDRIRW
jgi:hypothetical protein